MKIIQKLLVYKLGIQIRNMKMVFNISGTWHWVTFEKLMMKIHDFFIRISHLVTTYNIVQKSLRSTVEQKERFGSGLGSARI